ncbi:MAG: hypothetical protein ACM3MF_02790, partial [Anaerolineae bacterium]
RPLREVSSVESTAYCERAEQGLSASPPKQAQILRTAAMRYLGQGFEVEIRVDDPGDVERLEKDFHAAHQHEYGFSMPSAPVEWVELRVAWEVPAQAWAFAEQDANAVTNAAYVPVWEYRMDPAGAGQPVRTMAAVYERECLPVGTSLRGPLIVTEKDATTYVPTGWTGVASQNGYLRIGKDAEA